MKKIIMLSPAHPLRGGIASSTERLALELQKNGAEVVIYSFSLQYPSLLFPGKTQYTDDPPPPGLDIRVRINSINPLNWIRVAREVRREKADLLIVRFWIPFLGPSLGTIVRLAKRKTQTQAICIADNIIPHEKRPFDRLLTRYFIQSIDAFIVMSRAVGEELRTFSQKIPFSFIPHPIYDNYGPIADRKTSLQALELDPTQRYLLFFGFIRAYKGLDLLLKAFADDQLQAMPLKLIVAGEFYADEEQYRQLVAELGLSEKVLFFDKYIPREEVRFYFGAADLVVQPYKSATQSGISQLAYHFEKPMVVTRVGGLPEIIEDGVAGYVVDIDPDAIADAIVDFYEHKREQALLQGVQESKKRFSWENMVKGLQSLYQDLIK